jgi:RNA polymerase II subunit A small phosphatase-like protein
MGTENSILLVLDLDETLIFASDAELARPCDVKLYGYYLYKRPYLEQFLKNCATVYQIAIWSAGTEDYVTGAASLIFPDTVQPVFMWGRTRCVRRFDEEFKMYYYVKDLNKIRRKGFDLKRVLVVDDIPITAQRNYGNAIYMLPYRGDPEDRELRLLWQYLDTLSHVENVRIFEKRGWRTQFLPTLPDML